jgi:hypothetical protein
MPARQTASRWPKPPHKAALPDADGSIRGNGGGTPDGNGGSGGNGSSSIGGRGGNGGGIAESPGGSVVVGLSTVAGNHSGTGGPAAEGEGSPADRQATYAPVLNVRSAPRRVPSALVATSR